MTMRRPETVPTDLFRRVCATGTLRRAWEHLRRKAPGPGIDRVTVQDYTEDADLRLSQLQEKLRDGAYNPMPGMRVTCQDDFARKLTIPTIEDRIVQRAVAKTLSALYEPCLSDAAWAYRPGRSIHDVHRRINHQLSLGRPFFARTDVRKFFHSIDADRVVQELQRDGIGQRILELIRRLVNARAIEGVSTPGLDIGLSQGSALSPLLSNIYLRPVDTAMEQAGFPYFRYADDMLLLADGVDEVDRALERLADELDALELELNLRKTERGHVDDGFDYLGMHFDASGRRFSSDTLDALTGRAERLLEGDDGHPARVAELLEEWGRWYAPRRVDQMESLAVLSGHVWTVTRDGQPKPVVAAARQRLGFGLEDTLGPDNHLTLLEAWLSAGIPPGGNADSASVYRCALLEAHLALDKRADRRTRQRVCDALALPERSLAEHIARLDDDLPARLAEAGALTLADAARRLADLNQGPEDLDGAYLEGGRGQATQRDSVDPELVDALLDRFTGHDERHTVERKDNRNHYRFFEADGALDRDAVTEHLAGEQRRGFYQVDEDDRVRVAAIDLSLLRRLRLECRTKADREAGLAELESWTRKVQLHAAAMSRAAEGLGVPTLLEAAGRTGRRLWIFFDEPTNLRDVYLLLQDILSETGDPPGGIRQTPRPRKDKVRKGPGPRLPLPLGLDPKSGHPGHLVERDGTRIDGPAAIRERLAEAEAVSPETVQALVGVGPDHPSARQRTRRTVLERFEKFPNASKIMGRCGVMRLLADKAMRLGHLEDEERQSLFEVLGHLPGDEAQRSLSSALSGCGRNDPDFVNKRLTRLGEHPISCPKLQRRHSAQADACGCDCEFFDLPDHAYPTPLLHAMHPGEIDGFDSSYTPAAAASPDAGNHGEEEPDDAPPPPDQVEDALSKWSNVRQQLEDTERGLDRAREQLDALFENADTDRLPLEHGWLVRREGESPGYAIEF